MRSHVACRHGESRTRPTSGASGCATPATARYRIFWAREDLSQTRWAARRPSLRTQPFMRRWGQKVGRPPPCPRHVRRSVARLARSSVDAELAQSLHRARELGVGATPDEAIDTILGGPVRRLGVGEENGRLRLFCANTAALFSWRGGCSPRDPRSREIVSPDRETTLPLPAQVSFDRDHKMGVRSSSPHDIGFGCVGDGVTGVSRHHFRSVHDHNLRTGGDPVVVLGRPLA